MVRLCIYALLLIYIYMERTGSGKRGGLCRGGVCLNHGPTMSESVLCGSGWMGIVWRRRLESMTAEEGNEYLSEFFFPPYASCFSCC